MNNKKQQDDDNKPLYQDGIRFWCLFVIPVLAMIWASWDDPATITNTYQKAENSFFSSIGIGAVFQFQIAGFFKGSAITVAGFFSFIFGVHMLRFLNHYFSKEGLFRTVTFSVYFFPALISMKYALYGLLPLPLRDWAGLGVGMCFAPFILYALVHITSIVYGAVVIVSALGHILKALVGGGKS